MSSSREASNQKRDRAVSLDIVLPVFNEEESVGSLFERLREVFSPTALEQSGIRSVRFVFVDDGSRDRTPDLIAQEIAKGSPAILYRLTRNFGHQAALSAGLDHVDAEVVAILDADLQDPPEELLAMLARWREGYDVVYGQRAQRKENWLKRLGYFAFYRVLAYLSEGRVPKDSGDFSLFDRRVLLALRQLPERLRFVRGLRAWVGFRQLAHVYERSARRSGRSKYSWRDLYMLATDGIASMSIRPLQVAQFFAILFFCLTAGIGVYAAIGLFTGGPAGSIDSRLNLLLTLTSLIGFCTTFLLYILSAYVARTYLEVKNRPPYLVMEVIEPPDRPDAGPL